METKAASPQIIAECPECGAKSDVTEHEPFTKVSCPSCRAQFHARRNFNHFLLEAQCGVGGMSRVFRARDTSLERSVALKILNRACSLDSTRVRQFENEAEITARVSHPNVVRVFTAGRDQGYFYIAMELVEGGSLETLLRQQGKLPEARVLEIAVHAVQGLRAAHKAGLIHRDMKPGNILFAGDGTPKIVDFGLAIFARDADGRGEIWATPYYVPPETLYHEPEDFRSDIYSLGATLYHALLGFPPCEMDNAPLVELRAFKSKPVHVKASATKLSEETCALLERMLAVKRENRHRSYDELLDHIKYAQRQLRRGKKGKPWPGRRRRGIAPWAWGAGAAAMVTAAILWANYQPPNPRPPEEIAALIPDADPGADSNGAVSAQYVHAREAMLRGDFGQARGLFAELGGSSDTPQPTRHWAVFYAGLCSLFSGDNETARKSYESILQDGMFSTSAGAAGLAQFFVSSAAWLAANEVVPREKLQDCPGTDARAVGLLAAGLKNWNHGDAAAAAPFLESFAQSTPPAWLEDMKKLIAGRLKDAAAMATLATPDVSGFTAAEADAALAAARTALAGLSVPGAVKEKAAASVEALAASVSRRKQELAAASASSRAKVANDEFRQILETNAAALAAASRGDYQFAEAAAKLESLTITTPEATPVRDAHVETWRKAHRFIEQLARDLAARPAEGVVTRSGVPARALISASGGTLTAKFPEGPPQVVPMIKAPPGLLVELASDCRARVTDTDDYYRRSELLHAFALRTGLTATATVFGEDLAAEVPAFRRTLSDLNTVEVITAAPR
jgi:hypothetical protein